MTVCEIRIPTYKRPDMLRRALDNMRSQTVKDLRVVIFDDSPDGEGEAIAREASDLKVTYRRNPENLGISRNLGQCFRTAAYEEAEYAFCLEDDNTVFPDFIEKNIAAMEKAGTSILLRNQFIERTDNTINRDDKTMPDIFPPGVIDMHQVMTCIYTNVGISNGGLFWRTDARSELLVGEDCPDPVLIEYLRPFAIVEDILYSDQPLGTWRDNQEESFREKEDRIKARWESYRLLKVLSTMRRRTLEVLSGGDPEPLYGHCLPSRHAKIDRALANALMPVDRQGRDAATLARAYAKGLVVNTFSPSEMGARSAEIMNSKLDLLARTPAPAWQMAYKKSA